MKNNLIIVMPTALLTITIGLLLQYLAPRLQSILEVKLILAVFALTLFFAIYFPLLYRQERNKNKSLISPITKSNDLGFLPLGEIISLRHGRFDEADLALLDYSLKNKVDRFKANDFEGENSESNLDLTIHAYIDDKKLFKRHGDYLIAHPELRIK